MTALLPLIVIVAVAYRLTSPADRERYFKLALAAFTELKTAEQRRQGDLAPFHDALRQRTRWVVMTPLIAAVNAAVFAAIVTGTGSLNDPATLVNWGASIAPRTTNGEWWRLLSSVFVHSGFVYLLVCVGGVAQAGLLLERSIGWMGFAAVYTAGGAAASLVMLAGYPMAVTSGASGAVFATYGALAAVVLSAAVQQKALKIPLRALKGLAPAVTVFLLYHAGSTHIDGRATLAATGTGLAIGFALTLGLANRKPPLRRTLVATAAMAMVVIGAAVPLRGVIDVRPEIERLAAIEPRTVELYSAASAKFRQRKMSAEALAHLIDATIRPELEAARERLVALKGVLPEQQPFVTAAHTYCRLREESWRLRAEGLRKTNMLRLRQSESAEHAALEALRLFAPAER